MSIADMGRTSLKNNKREKCKMFDSFAKVPDKRIFKAKEKNPNIKEMSKKELKAYRVELQKKASFKLKAFWLSFIVLFLLMFVYFAFLV